jgi:hypothetical protein
MARASTKRGRYGTKLIVERVLGAAPSGLSTRQLVTEVRKIAGTGIPYNTVFQAAKSLVKARTASSRRAGREYIFSSIQEHAEAGEPSVDRTKELAESSDGTGSMPSEPSVAFPHKLDPGQVLVLSHDGKSVVTLTNVHGKAQIERHPIE